MSKFTQQKSKLKPAKQCAAAALQRMFGIRYIKVGWKHWSHLFYCISFSPPVSDKCKYGRFHISCHWPPSQKSHFQSYLLYFKKQFLLYSQNQFIRVVLTHRGSETDAHFIASGVTLTPSPACQSCCECDVSPRRLRENGWGISKGSPRARRTFLISFL